MIRKNLMKRNDSLKRLFDKYLQVNLFINAEYWQRAVETSVITERLGKNSLR